MHGITGYRKLDYYTVCCWQQLLRICTVARGGSRGTVNCIITLCAVGSSYYQYARLHGVVARGTVNLIITLCVGVVVAKATLRHAISTAWLRQRVVRCTC